MKNKEGVSFVIYDEQSLNRAKAWLNNFKRTEGVNMEVVVRPYNLTRSQQQNKLMWKWIKEIGDEIGMNTHDLHEEFKEKFLKPILERDDENFREIIFLARKAFLAGLKGLAIELNIRISRFASTTMLDTKQMTEYLESIEKHAAWLGIKLTDPEPDPRKRT